MQSPDTCQAVVLAKDDCCSIEYCAHCDIAHLNVAAVTLRFRLPVLRRLSATLAAALQRFDRNNAGLARLPAGVGDQPRLLH